jgi:hypothetical protein
LPDIAPIDADTRIVNDDGRMTDVFQRWVNDVTNNDLLVGTGSPEGVIEATVGREYLDDTGLAGAVKFIKQLPDIGGDRTMGWVAV